MRNKFSLLLLLMFVVIISGCVDKGDTPASSNSIRTPQESATSEQAAIQEPPKTCADNTPYNKCSAIKPKYCENGTLIDKANLCGCPSKYGPVQDTCVKKKCSDETLIDECSINKPKRCVEGTSTTELIDAPIKCGCPSGYELIDSLVCKPILTFSDLSLKASDFNDEFNSSQSTILEKKDMSASFAILDGIYNIYGITFSSIVKANDSSFFFRFGDNTTELTQYVYNFSSEEKASAISCNIDDSKEIESGITGVRAFYREQDGQKGYSDTYYFCFPKSNFYERLQLTKYGDFHKWRLTLNDLDTIRELTKTAMDRII